MFGSEKGLARIAAAMVALSTFVVPVSAGAYPPAGLDSFDSSAMVFFTLDPTCSNDALAQSAVLNGPTTIQRFEPRRLPDGRETFDTEMLQLDLSGAGPAGPVRVRQDPDRDSLGRVIEQVAGGDFPADSFFDVFVEIDVGGLTLENLVPIHMQSVIYSLPPHKFPYLPPPNTCIPLGLEGSPVPLLWLDHAEHGPRTARDCFPAFTGLTLLDPSTSEIYNATATGTAQFVHGIPPPGTKVTATELIAMSSQGVATDQRGGRSSFAINEAGLADGSYGGWAIDSFFDITYRIDFGGHPNEGVVRAQGTYDPVAGGTLQVGTSKGDGVVILGGMLHLGSATLCPDNYPPA